MFYSSRDIETRSKKSRLRGFFVLQREDYFFASGAAGAGAAGAAAGGAASAGAAAGAAGAGAGFGSSFLPQAAKATANIAASNSDFFICKFL